MDTNKTTDAETAATPGPAFDPTDPGTWTEALTPQGYVWREINAETGEHHLFAPDGTNLSAALPASPPPAPAPLGIVRFDSPSDGHLTSDAWVVAVYTKKLIYMGPEEGGWYWTRRELHAMATAPTEEAATALCGEMEAGPFRSTSNYRNVNFGRRSGDTDYSLYIVAPGESVEYDNDDERPHHYE